MNFDASAEFLAVLGTIVVLGAAVSWAASAIILWLMPSELDDLGDPAEPGEPG
jgi:hypothetical protein